VFQTVDPEGKALSWLITDQPPAGQDIKQGSMVPGMRPADYWIISCGKELIRDHNDLVYRHHGTLRRNFPSGAVLAASGEYPLSLSIISLIVLVLGF
jgi:hypothetical protein